jgi:hypothetical protein
MKVRRWLVALAAAATLLYVWRGGWSGASELSDPAGGLFEWFGAGSKLACLVLGTVYAFRVTRRLDRANRARRPWLLVGLWLASFTVGQLALSYYALVLHRLPPLPSIGDPPFVLGYLLMLAAGVDFVRAYRSTGFPIGSARELGAIAAAAAVVLALVGAPLLEPIASADVPAAERLINLTYPVLDLAALVLALVLLRVTLVFRGGKVWHVWAVLNAGFVSMSAGDVLFAYLSSAKKASVQPFVDLTLLLGYLFAALGTVLQDELLSEGPAPGS